MTEYQTRAVLAGSYATSASPTMLTHTVAIDESDAETLLCDRVAWESLADPMAWDVDAKPSCRVCARRDPRFKT